MKVLLIFPPCWGPQRWQGLCSDSVLFWAPSESKSDEAVSDISPLLGTLRWQWLCSHFAVFWARGEGRGDGAIFDVVPLLPPSHPSLQGLWSPSALFWAP